MKQQRMPLATPTIWTFSAAWCSKKLDCSPSDKTRCSGHCCMGGQNGHFWPGNSGQNNCCPLLGPEGCMLDMHARPVTCLLYPLRINKIGRVVLHYRAISTNGMCRPNMHTDAPPLISAMQPALSALLGTYMARYIANEVLAGKNARVTVPAHIALALDIEAARSIDKLPPLPRAPKE